MVSTLEEDDDDEGGRKKVKTLFGVRGLRRPGRGLHSDFLDELRNKLRTGRVVGGVYRD